MLALGPPIGILLNALIYLPMVLWLRKAPYGPRFRKEYTPPARAVRGFGDITGTIRDVAGNRTIVSMILLAGCASFFIGQGYQAQMPGFAHDLGHDDAGVSYSMLLAANAGGAFIAGIVLESRGLLPPNPRTALILALVWCLAIVGFAGSSVYFLALALLFVAGFLELSFNAMAMTLVQLRAPAHIRGRVIGLYNMSALGLRAFSGVTIGVVGGMIGIHWSLALSAMALLAITTGLLAFSMRKAS
jgi:MFS family permease